MINSIDESIKVSIVCITYNHEKYIKKMLNSVINQNTNFNYELLIHDDASTDETPEIIKEFQKKYPNIIKPILQYENQYSKGINPNITYNYPRVKGKYIAYCEGDDYWSNPQKLQLQFDAMEKNDECAICVHNTQFVSRYEKKLNKMFPPVKIKEGVITSEQYINMELRLVGWLFQTSSYFIRSNIIKKYVEECQSCYPVGDLPLVLYSLQYGNCYYINASMSCYRWDSGGAISSLRNREKAVAFYDKMISGHRYFDKAMEFKYHDDYEFAIQKCEFAILFLQKKYKQLCLPIYKQQRKNVSFKRRFLIRIGCYFPELVDYIERKKNKWTK